MHRCLNLGYILLVYVLPFWGCRHKDPYGDTLPWTKYFSYSDKAVYYYSRREYGKELYELDSMIQTIRFEPKDSLYLRYYGETLLNKGRALLELDRPQEAFQEFYLARAIASKTEDPFVHVRLDHTLGYAAYLQHRYWTSEEYFDQSNRDMDHISEMISEEKRTVYQENLDNIGLCYAGRGLPDSALYYFDSALWYIDRNILPVDMAFGRRAEAVVKGNKAAALLAKNDYGGAEQLLKESVWLNRAFGIGHEDLMRNFLHLGQIYVRQGRRAEAEQAMALCKAQLDSFPETRTLADWYALKSSFYLGQGYYRDAYQYELLSRVEADSLRQRVLSIAPLDMDSTFSSLQNEYELRVLTEKRKADRLYYLLALLTAIFVIVLIILRYRRHQRRIQQLLAQVEQVSDVQLHQLETVQLAAKQEERRRIGQELHDDFSTTIAAILNYFYFQSGSASDAAERERLLHMRDLLAESYERARAKSHKAFYERIEDDFWERLPDMIHLFFTNSGIALSLDIDSSEVTLLPGEIKAAIVYTIKECCTNIIRHAHATSASILMYCDGAYLHLVVEDNGRGILGKQKGMGLQSIAGRIDALGGSLDIQGAVGKGVQIEVVLPITI